MILRAGTTNRTMQRTIKLRKKLDRCYQTNKISDYYRHFPKKTKRGHFTYNIITQWLCICQQDYYIFKLPPQCYKKLLHGDITKSYKKSPTRLEKYINWEAKEIAAEIKLIDRIKCIAEAPAYITLKDHKDNF